MHHKRDDVVLFGVLAMIVLLALGGRIMSMDVNNGGYTLVDAHIAPIESVEDGQIKIDQSRVRVNVNTADQQMLLDLPGIGPVISERIIAYRDAHGPFMSLQDMDLVEGIGPAMLEKLADYVYFE